MIKMLNKQIALLSVQDPLSCFESTTALQWKTSELGMRIASYLLFFHKEEKSFLYQHGNKLVFMS